MVRDEYLITKDYKTASIEILVENLPSLRAKIGITQEELANILGISRQTYYSLETQKREMSWITYLAIVFIFDSVRDTSEIGKLADGLACIHSIDGILIAEVKDS